MEDDNSSPSSPENYEWSTINLNINQLNSAVRRVNFSNNDDDIYRKTPSLLPTNESLVAPSTSLAAARQSTSTASAAVNKEKRLKSPTSTSTM
ncbi:hypothetical protein OUZ56_005517 [Daphnia magna]|uniref:Uncharacterized protein n=1 Tax=Daphnia magna TaxID=35525 RepID=A0ABQ9YT01_9CRUS|nr:hypothetical protein OUZ56_005517 [Daphnia magna]